MKQKKIEYADNRQVRSVSRDGSGKTLKQMRNEHAKLVIARNITEVLKQDCSSLDKQIEELETYFFYNFLR